LSVLLAFVLTTAIAEVSHGGESDRELDYAPAGPAIKVVLIDQAERESFVAVRVDTAGRIFVGGREALFVYEPDDQGGYLPRRELYRFPPESWVFDVEIRGHDLYVMTASALYLLPDAVTRRDGITVKRLIWGQPLGHIQLGFHGLAWGPEGDLYFTMGDALQHYGDFNRPDHWGHWTLFSQPEGTKTPYTGVGAVLRCQADGSGLRVVAGGTFNSFGLAFDRHWNLFTNDNDREAMPAMYVPARLLHVTPHAYFSWPRGWMASKSPDRADLLETMYSGMGRAAPVGMAYYDDALLPAAHRHRLLMARWARRSVNGFTIVPRGASFKAEERPLLIGRREARPLGVCVGCGGRVFLTIGYMAQLEGSPTYRSDLVMLTSTDDRPERRYDGYDAPAATAQRLWEELSNPSWQRRYRAHIEILRRNGPFLVEATERSNQIRGDDPAVNHLPWLAGASGTADACETLVKLARAPDAALRLQAIRALAEFRQLKPPREILEQAINDPDPKVCHSAIVAFFNAEGSVPQQIINGPARSKDTYLRQAATLLLARRAKTSLLTEICESNDPAVRLAGVLSTGFRLTLPPATEPLPEHLPLDPYPDSANVIQFADTKLDLRRFARVGNFTVAEHWRAGEHHAEQERLFALLLKRLQDENEPVRLQAAHFLSLLNDPRSESLVTKAVAATEKRRLEGAPVSILKSVSEVWALGPFPDGPAGLREVHPPEKGPVDLSAQYPAGGTKVGWKKVGGGYFDFVRTYGQHDHASFYAHCRLASVKPQWIMLFVGSNDGVKVWHNGEPVWKNETVRRALRYDDMVMLRLGPGSNDLLFRVHNETGDSGLLINFKALDHVVPTLPEKLDMSILAERLKEAGSSAQQTTIPAQFLDVDWPQAVAEGKRKQGEKLFEKLGCVKCHTAKMNEAGGVGPSLAEVGKRFTIPQLVQSILLPNQQVSPVFRATSIVTEEGKVLSGLVVGETAEKLEMVLTDTKRATILKADIDERVLQDISPMPPKLVATPDELRDLLAFLFAENDQQ